MVQRSKKLQMVLQYKFKNQLNKYGNHLLLQIFEIEAKAPARRKYRTKWADSSTHHHLTGSLLRHCDQRLRPHG